jgi:hypothetical protein
VSNYKECISCKGRTQFTCIICGYCYSCHWKEEKIESERNDSAVIEKYPQPAMIAIEQSSVGQKAMDVYGQQIEPICNYRTCNHKFSEHGHKCKCHHALNYATGVSILPLTKI